MTTVLFACRQNAGRSQMAAALFNLLAHPSKASALSAGTTPAKHVHPEVVDIMNEIGIDLAQAKPMLLTPDLASQAQILVTMGCGEECPVVPGVRRMDWALDDPASQSLEEVRRIRDEIRTRVAELVQTEGWSQSPS